MDVACLRTVGVLDRAGTELLRVAGVSRATELAPARAKALVR